MGCTTCTGLLNEALNLTVRGRNLDAIQRRQSNLDAASDPVEWKESGGFDRYVARHNQRCEPWDRIEHRSLSPQLWLEDQFQRDLYDWESRCRAHMTGAHP